MKQLVITPAAENDLRDIWLYTLETWGAEQADGYLAQIDAKMHGLQSGATHVRSASYVAEGLLSALAGKHLLFFRTTEAQIIIIRVLHQHMDSAAKLSDYKQKS